MKPHDHRWGEEFSKELDFDARPPNPIKQIPRAPAIGSHGDEPQGDNDNG